MHQILQRLRQLISPSRRPRTKTVQVDVQDLELLLNDYDRMIIVTGKQIGRAHV